MTDEFTIILAEDGTFKEYDDEYDVTIHCESQVEQDEVLAKLNGEQEPKTDYKAFAEWVAGEIFSAEWEFNKDSFAEVACRKLEKLGLVKADGENWILEQEPIANANTPHLTVDEYIRTRKNKNND